MAAIYYTKSDDKTKDASVASDDCVANHQVHHDQNSVIRQSILSRMLKITNPIKFKIQSIYILVAD